MLILAASDINRDSRGRRAGARIDREQFAQSLLRSSSEIPGSCVKWSGRGKTVEFSRREKFRDRARSRATALHFHRSLEMRIETIERGLSIGLQFCVDFAAGNRECGKKINGVLAAVNSLQASIAVTTCYISSIIRSANRSSQRSAFWNGVFSFVLTKEKKTERDSREETRF